MMILRTPRARPEKRGGPYTHTLNNLTLVQFSQGGLVSPAHTKSPNTRCMIVSNTFIYHPLGPVERLSQSNGLELHDLSEPCSRVVISYRGNFATHSARTVTYKTLQDETPSRTQYSMSQYKDGY